MLMRMQEPWPDLSRPPIDDSLPGPYAGCSFGGGSWGLLRRRHRADASIIASAYQLQAEGIHNSYHLKPPWSRLDSEWDYSHSPTD